MEVIMVKKLTVFLFFPLFYVVQCLGNGPQTDAAVTPAAIAQETANPIARPRARKPMLPKAKPQQAQPAGKPFEPKKLSPQEEAKQKQAQQELDKFFKELEEQVKKLEAEAKKKEAAKPKETESKSDKKEERVATAGQIPKAETATEAKNS